MKIMKYFPPSGGLDIEKESTKAEDFYDGNPLTLPLDHAMIVEYPKDLRIDFRFPGDEGPFLVIKTDTENHYRNYVQKIEGFLSGDGTFMVLNRN